MKLKTPYFNPTVLKKDITRFAPVWILYTLYLLAYIILGNGGASGAWFAYRTGKYMVEFSRINLIYAGIVATLVFGDLFKRRLCNALHAMPLRREGWFLTHCVSGLLFALGPNLIALSIGCTMMLEYSYIAFIWLAAEMLQYLFFFALAALCAQCSGSRLAMIGLYCLLNFIAPLIYWLANLLYMPYLYGLNLDAAPFRFFCPVMQLSSQSLVLFEYVNPKEHGVDPYGIWDGFVAESWYYLFGLAAVGLILGAVALLLYRRRNLECAGDFLVLKPAKLLFLVFASLVSGGLLYGIAKNAEPELAWAFMLAGMLVGYLAATMLLERKVLVFKKKNWLGFMLLALFLAFSLLLTRIDPLGLTRRIPATEQVKSVTVQGRSGSSVLESLPKALLKCTKQEDIEAIRQLHQLVLENRPGKEDDPSSLDKLTIRYELKSGKFLSREYYLPKENELYQPLKAQMSSPEYIIQSQDWDRFVNSINLVILRSELIKITDPENSDNDHRLWITDPDDIQRLMAAVYADCLEGNMAQYYRFHSTVNAAAALWLGHTGPEDSGYLLEKDGQYYQCRLIRELNVYLDSKHTWAFIQDYVAEHGG